LDEIPIENSSDAMQRNGFRKVSIICVTPRGTEVKLYIVEDKILWLAQKA